MTVRLIAVDPWDCGCTECIIGEHVALWSATDENIADLLAGRLRNNLGEGTELVVSTTCRTERDRLRVISVQVSYTHWDGAEKSWTPDLYRAGLAK